MQGMAYWGKSRPAWHLLPYHCLDVAAVGQTYLRRHHRLRKHLAQTLSLPEDTLVDWMGFFLALHDLGKFAQSFQDQRKDIRAHLQPGIVASCNSRTRHDSLGFMWWKQHMSKQAAEEEWLGALSGADAETAEDALDLWMQAVTGHHGRPPHSDGNDRYELRHAFTAGDAAAAAEFVQQMRDLLLASTRPTHIHWRALGNACRPLSWWLAGIAVLADWLGSNTRWFDYVDDPDYGLQRYWRRAQRQAQVALTESGVMPLEVARAGGLTALFPHIEQPTPLQRACAELDLSPGPQLFLLEDVTGAGKTEAALLLAHRLMAAGHGDGLYFALPTMATAGAMYGRLTDCYRRLFAGAAGPSLVLAHGASHLDPQFRASVLDSVSVDLDGNDEGAPETAGARCNAWLADSRKRALLAHVGAGTIDQALLAVLQSRHQSLRLLGLFGKVLIVDEVHANDAYMHELLQQALIAHASGGGSAVVLSATLPAKMRADLVKAFRSGLGCTDRVDGATQPGYPLLTRVDASPTALATATETRPQLRRRVQVRRVGERSAIIEHLLATAAAGRCGAWICNTVADARAAYRDLHQAMLQRGLDVSGLSLFHSRFAMGDRRRIEDAVLRDLGKEHHDRRAGRLVVGTQVLQESLDIDFDEMVTDLAPIDLIIQRAGRLRRHLRGADGACHSDGSADARGAPDLWVHGPAPAPDAGADWYRDAFPIAAHVYPDHAALWRTAHWLQRGGFAMPDDARDMIEQVFGDVEDAIDAPPALQSSADRAFGEQRGQAAQARFNAIDFGRGYSRGSNDWLDDARTPTRLGAEEVPLRLAVWDGEGWRPLHGEGPSGWEWSTVKIRAFHARKRETLADPHMEQAANRAEQSLPDRGRWSVLLPLIPVAAGEMHMGEVVDQRDNRLRLHYNCELGLMREED